jgi:hypothetical protein
VIVPTQVRRFWAHAAIGYKQDCCSLMTAYEARTRRHNPGVRRQPRRWRVRERTGRKRPRF